MAKLHNYYVLCPLIDQKSFLGVSVDVQECVLVTLGRNVVNKYRLTDQKQIGGWTSKDHITAAVIHDAEQGVYVGVFNNNIIKMWKEDCDNLDKMKKYKFSLNILNIIPRSNQVPLIIFSNGSCASLPYAIENRKTFESKSLMKENDEIVKFGCYTQNNIDYICYIVKNNHGYEIVNSPLRHELGDMEKSKLIKVKITRPEDVHVVGKLINTADKPSVFILWSDSKLTMYDLVKKSWKTIGMVPWISTSCEVSLAWMAKRHLIFFGNNLEQDGAIIVVYNTLLGIGSCRYPMKIYSEGAKLYCMNKRIILEASNHIGMLPYVLEIKRNLSKLLGSHEIIQDNKMEIADWETPTALTFKTTPLTQNIFMSGTTERIMYSHIIPTLIEKNNINEILHTLKVFKDIPENCIVLLLNYAIKMMDKINNITNSKLFMELLCSNENRKPIAFLDTLLFLPFSDALMIPYLRKNLSLDDALFLMSYISHAVMNPVDIVGYGSTAEKESKLYDWCILLMDAFYQQFLMSKDKKVTWVLKKNLSVVRSLTQQLSAVNKILPLLNKFVTGNISNDNEEILSYTMEMIKI